MFRTDAVVTDAAVRRPRRPEDLAGVAVFKLHDLVVDLDVPDSRRGSLTRWDVSVSSLCGEKRQKVVIKNHQRQVIRTRNI